MVNSPVVTRLCQLVGTMPRLAKSSSTRGITPGSASAWTEKQAVGWVSGGRREAAAGSMVNILDIGRRAKGTGPILGNEDRGANSPGEPAIEAPVAHN
jgi:hypothetical protein